MRYNKDVKSGLWLSKFMEQYSQYNESDAGSPWPGLRVRCNRQRTGFDVINDFNERTIAKINLLSRGGEWFTSYLCLTKPSSFQKKDLQCVPITMGKPKSNALTDCTHYTKNIYTSAETTTWGDGGTASSQQQWYGGHGTANSYGNIETTLPHLVYDSKGNYVPSSPGGLFFEPRLMNGGEYSAVRSTLDAAWLHVNQSGLTPKEWYQNIFETLNKVKGCTVDKRRMLTLAARSYASVKKAADNLPGSVIHLMPMILNTDEGSPKLPLGRSNMFDMAETEHCLGTLEKGNYCTLPTIVIVVPKIHRDTYYENRLSLEEVTVASDWAYGEVITIPPVGATNLTRRATTSIGADGSVRQTPNRHGRPVYEPSDLDKLDRRKDSGLSKEDFKDKYSAWCEPWRTCKVLRNGGRMKYDWVRGREEIDSDDLMRLTKRGSIEGLSFLQEQFVRNSLHDFSQDDEHVGVLTLGEYHKEAMPHAVRVDDLGSDLVAETIVNQLPLA